MRSGALLGTSVGGHDSALDVIEPFSLEGPDRDEAKYSPPELQRARDGDVCSHAHVRSFVLLNAAASLTS